MSVILNYNKNFYLILFIFFIYVQNIYGHSIHTKEFEINNKIMHENEISSPSISPDGIYIAYKKFKEKGFFIKNSKNNTEIQIAKDFFVDDQLKWSFNSEYLAYTINIYKKKQIIILKKDNNIFIKDKNSSIYDRFSDYSWIVKNGLSALYKGDSKNIIFTSTKNSLDNKTGKSQNISYSKYKYDNSYVFSRNKLVLKKDNSIVKTFRGTIYMPSLSPYKTHLMFSQEGKIMIFEYANNKLLTVDVGSNARWSPDNKNIVYQTEKDNGHFITNSDILLFNIKSEKKYNVTNSNNKLEVSPTFSSDSTKIHFAFTNLAEIGIIKLNEVIK